jgi:tetratricopeptide (TPR) repeat protein
VALAETYLVAGQYQDALSQAEQVVTLYPEHEAALLIAGLAAARLDRPDAALAPLEQFVAQRQDGPMARADMALETAYYFLGESYLKLDRPGEAIPILEAALEIDGVDADALYQAGLAYHATGQPEIALQKYYDAVRLVPDFVEAYRGMSEIYRTMDQAGYDTYAQGMVAFCERDHAAAAANLERATEALPDFGPAFRGLGLTYEQMGRLGEALTALQRALMLAPDDLASQQAIGRIQTTLDTEN